MQFDRILRLDGVATVTRQEADVGTLTVDDGSLNFDGRHPLSLTQIISVDRVHSNAYAHDVLQVDYSDGGRVGTAYFTTAYRRGGAQAIDQLFGLLEGLSQSGESAPIDARAVAEHRQAATEIRAASNRAATTLMWAGAALFLAGVIAIVMTRGTYLLAWAAPFLGVGTFLRGFTTRQR